MGQPHTGHNAVFTRTRQTRPTKIVTFPRYKAEKSPFQQHDLSILIVGPNQLKHRLSRTRKPKSYPSSNTQCPITRQRRAAHDQRVRPRYGQDGPLQRRRVQSLAVEHDVRAHHGGARRTFGGIHTPTMKQPTSMWIFPHQQAKKSLQNQHVLSYNPTNQHNNRQRTNAPRHTKNRHPRSDVGLWWS